MANQQQQFPDEMEAPSRRNAARQTDAPIPPDEGDLQWVLVPVSHADHAKRRQRMRLLGFAFFVFIALIGYWLYRRTVDPIQALDEFDAGERFLKVARYQQAIVSFDRAIDLKSDFADAYALRGRTNVALNKPLLAIPDFSNVIELRPRDPIGFLDRGSSYLAVNEIQSAIKDFTRAIELDPKLSRAYNLRGIATRTLGKTAESMADFNKAVEIDPNMDNLYQRGATFQALGDHEHAIADFTAVIGFDPSAAQGYYARSQSYRASGDLAAAERDHQMARRNDAR